MCEQQEESLKLHAEKKALAMLLSHGEEDLSVSINFNACIDCHEFFKVSSQMLGRRIQLHQPQMTHTFIAGKYTCHTQWSWEAKLTHTMQITVANTNKGGSDVPRAPL